MAQWLKADLEKTSADWLVAYWHHPPYTKGSHDSDKEQQLIEMREYIMPILESGGVDLVALFERLAERPGFYVPAHHEVEDDDFELPKLRKLELTAEQLKEPGHLPTSCIITPRTGAVVLENAEQYATHDLDPDEDDEAVASADRSKPPSVPEPEEWALFGLGLALLAFRKIKARAA